MNSLPQSREGAEPKEMPRRVPLIVAALVVFVTVWGVWMFITEVPNGLGEFGDHRTPSALAATAAAPAATDGPGLFATHCVACHQASGQGLPGAFPPLAGSEWVAGPPDRLAAILLNGLKGEIKVRKKRFNSVMPAFRDKLTDEQIALLLSHIRSSFGNSAAEVTVSTVTAARQRTKGRTVAIDGGAELRRLFPN